MVSAGRSTLFWTQNNTFRAPRDVFRVQKNAPAGRNSVFWAWKNAHAPRSSVFPEGKVPPYGAYVAA